MRVSALFLCLVAQAPIAMYGQKNFNGASQTTIRITGDPAISPLLEKWEQGFDRAHPETKFENRLSGPASAMAGLYTNRADIAFAGHELLTSESMAFEWIFHSKPLGIEVTSGSVGGPYFAPAFFVSSKNPLSTLSIAQARSLLGCELRDGTHPIRKWGDLGVQGDWADRSIHVYAYQTESELGVFIRRKVLQNNYKWNCEMKTFGPPTDEANPQQDGSTDILEAVRKDPYGIAVSNVRYVTPDLKVLSLTNSGPNQAFSTSPQAIINRQYPLTRPFFVYLNRQPGRPVRTEIVAFLQFVLSNQGQGEVLKDGIFLPLSDSVAREQSAKLE